MKQVIILFGPPGAGKGTQSELLSDRLGLHIFETSKILEREFTRAENLSEDSDERFIEFDNQKFDILNEKKLWKEGKLCSPPFVTCLVIKEIKKLFEEGKGLILSGSPRTLYEAEKIMPLLRELYGKENIKTVLIEITPEQTIFRNSHRKICELMRHPVLYAKETENLTICPLDGSKLIKREGLDDPETIKVRLKEYAERTAPIFDYFKSRGLEIKNVNGEQSVADVYKDVLDVIK
ncbi:MAG: adenylate kinase [Parcubacteria group bacterium Licking1014_1]|nr:MAG: adenylate kinase [Parcubacteria group bacterium Licking1014_1]